jgi:hypothetical protein
MCLLLYVFYLVFFAYGLTTNDIADENIQLFSKCLDFASDSSISCVVSKNYTAPKEDQDITLAGDVNYEILSSSTEIFALTLDLKKILVNGKILFKNLNVLYLFVCLFIF